jgi:hypothetical protein
MSLSVVGRLVTSLSSGTPSSILEGYHVNEAIVEKRAIRTVVVGFFPSFSRSVP